MPNEVPGVERRVKVNLYGHLKLSERGRNGKFEEVRQATLTYPRNLISDLGPDQFTVLQELFNALHNHAPRP